MYFSPFSEKKIVKDALENPSKAYIRKVQSAPCLKTLGKLASLAEEDGGAQQKISAEYGPDRDMLFLNTVINERPVRVKIDTGSRISVMSSAATAFLDLGHLIPRKMRRDPGATNKTVTIGEISGIDVFINGPGFSINNVRFTVIDDDSNHVNITLGLDILRQENCLIDLVANRIYFGGFHGTSVDMMQFETKRKSSEKKIRWGFSKSIPNDF